MEQMCLLRSRHDHVADPGDAPGHDVLVDAVLDDLVAVVAVQRAQKYSISAFQSCRNEQPLMRVSFLLGQVHPVVSVEFIDVQFSYDPEMLVQAVLGDQSLHALQFVVDDCRRDRRIVGKIPLMRAHCPQDNHNHLCRGYHKHDRYVGKKTDQQPHDDVHNAVRDHSAQYLCIHNFRNRTDMDRVP